MGTPETLLDEVDEDSKDQEDNSQSKLATIRSQRKLVLINTPEHSSRGGNNAGQIYFEDIDHEVSPVNSPIKMRPSML